MRWSTGCRAELVETVTDPDYNAWTSGSGNNENADMCNPFASGGSWGATSTASNGSTFNVTLGSRSFLLPRNWLNANGGSCTLAYPHSTARFDGGDTRLYTATGDWRVGSFKSECGPKGAVTGLSNDWGTKKAHSAFCTDSAAVPKFPHNACTVVDFSNGDNRRTTSTGDWDTNFVKGECGTNEYIAGISQRTNGFVDAILCCPGTVSHASCAPRYNYAGDSAREHGERRLGPRLRQARVRSWTLRRGRCAQYARRPAGVRRPALLPVGGSEGRAVSAGSPARLAQGLAEPAGAAGAGPFERNCFSPFPITSFS